MIRAATRADAGDIAAIYAPYVLETTITFEETVVSREQMAERITSVTARYPWLVCEEHGKLLGYAYASAWKDRSAYRFACETSIYLDRKAHGRGIGTRLYASLLEELRQRGLRVAIGGIALPNPASVALHERLGFRKVAHFDAVGYKFSKSIDVGYWQRRLAEV